jgi:serine protease Do
VRLSQGGALTVRFAIGDQRAECGVNAAGGLSCAS